MNLAKLHDIKSKQRNHLHFNILTMKNQKEKLWNQSHSPLQQKKIKSLGIDLPKETKELYTEYYNTLMKEFKDDINIPSLERYSMFLGRKNQYCENYYTTKCNLQIQCLIIFCVQLFCFR